ncbi:MAG: DUF3737 family protein [Bacilli bacterium]|nr:DUF3737 family protein [Bacilli bacterium]
MKTVIENRSFDEERALYGIGDTVVRNCVFAGPLDGESSLKETRDIEVLDSSFSLRYPLWHVKGFRVDNVKMDEKTRAALWYDEDGEISSSYLHGIKAVRECKSIRIKGCDVLSEEFGWKSDGLRIIDTKIESVYPFFDSKNLYLEKVNLKGKYSFQYVENMEIRDSILDTKDAFWHSKNVTVKDSVIKGEYLGWFAEGLTLINCKIIGTQPLCYCKNLKLIDCTMEGCDLSFEYSEVEGNVIGHVESIKNVLKGRIEVDTLGELITSGSNRECKGEVVVNRK